MEFLIEYIAPLMFVGLVFFLLSGFPISFSLAATGFTFAVIGIALGIYNPNSLQALPGRVFQSAIMNDTLLAVPFFTFMGLILERSGMAEDLLDTIGQLFGPVRGGLAYAIILVGGLLAATTGVVAASVIAMGLISLPLMRRYGYNDRVATGVIAASGTLAQIIPPSLVLIVLASQLNVPVGDMYQAAFKPGLLLMGLYALYIFMISMFKPKWVPALPESARTFKRTARGGSGVGSLILILAIGVALAVGVYHWVTQDVAQGKHLLGAVNAEESYNRAFILVLAGVIVVLYSLAKLDAKFKWNMLSDMAQRVVFVLVPPLALVFLVLGTIGLGIATPTEGGGLGALGAVILAMAKGRLNLNLLRQGMDSTLKLTSFVILILIGSSVFNAVFQFYNGNVWVEHLLSNIPGGKIGFLIFINILFFVLAFFLEFFELSFILVPLVAPVAEKLGIDLVWLGVLLAVNMQTSFLHPPFGFALIYLRSVADKAIRTLDIYIGAIPFVLIQLGVVALILFVPSIIHSNKKTVAAGAGATGSPTVQTPLDLNVNQTAPKAVPAPTLDLAPNAAQPTAQPSAPAAAPKATAPTVSTPNASAPAPKTGAGAGSPAFDFVPSK